MQFINDIDLLAGKTIKQVQFFNFDDILMLTFADDTYICIATKDYTEWEELTQDIDNNLKLRAGIMTKQEYTELLSAASQRQAEYAEAADRRKLALLLKKYGPLAETTK